MMYSKIVLEYMEFQVELPILFYIDNIGPVDLDKNWSSGGSNWYMETKTFFLRNL